MLGCRNHKCPSVCHQGESWHALMHEHTLLKEHTLVHEHSHSCMNTHSWRSTHSCMNTHTHAWTHTPEGAHTRAWTLTLVHEHAHTHAWTRSHSCMNTHTLVHEHVLKLENTGYYEIFRHCFQMLRRALPISCRCFWARVVITYFHDGFTQKYITFWRQQVKIKLNIVYIFTKMLRFSTDCFIVLSFIDSSELLCFSWCSFMFICCFNKKCYLYEFQNLSAETSFHIKVTKL